MNRDTISENESGKTPSEEVTMGDVSLVGVPGGVNTQLTSVAYLPLRSMLRPGRPVSVLDAVFSRLVASWSDAPQDVSRFGSYVD